MTAMQSIEYNGRHKNYASGAPYLRKQEKKRVSYKVSGVRVTSEVKKDKLKKKKNIRENNIEKFNI